MRFGEHTITVTIRTPDGMKYGYKTSLTEEFVSATSMREVGTHAERAVIEALNGAYDDYHFTPNDIHCYNDFERELVWQKVKNINTDEELEEIREILRIEE